MICWFELGSIDTLLILVWIWAFCFWQLFWIFLETQFNITSKFINQICWFSIEKSGQQLNALYSNLKIIRVKLGLWECTIRKIQNGRHDIIKCEFSKEKKLQDNICQIIVVKFYHNRHSHVGCRASTHRQTHIHAHTHTYTQTHTLGFDCNIFSQNDWIKTLKKGGGEGGGHDQRHPSLGYNYLNHLSSMLLE